MEMECWKKSLELTRAGKILNEVIRDRRGLVISVNERIWQ